LHIPDASENSGTVTVADETVTLRRTTGGDYAIAGLAVTPLAPQLNGPHVLHAQTGGTTDARTVAIAFDSDLDPATVMQAITVSGLGDGGSAMVRYDAPTRTIIVTLPGGLPDMTKVAITVGPSLHDIDGNALSQAYSTTVIS
ncbi:MAG TPA: Ig-like domain-containing protein, partial [Candidatus Dormibacteraeota bacterium]